MRAVLVLMVGCAVLFGLLDMLQIPPLGFLCVCIFFIGVALSQIVLFGGRAPRLASCIAGGLLLPLMIMAATIATWNPHRLLHEILPGLICTAPSGAMLGYLAGTLSAGVFFVSERLMGGSREKPPRRFILRLAEPGDFDTLRGWIRSPAALWFWAADEFSYPLDAAQWERHRAAGAPFGQEPVAATLVDEASGRMHGYAELAEIHPIRRTARLSLPIVWPDAHDRGALSVAMVGAMLRLAFWRLGLRRVTATVPVADEGSRACLTMAGFAEEGRLRDVIQWDLYDVVSETLVLLAALRTDWRAGAAAWTGTAVTIHLQPPGEPTDEAPTG